MSETNEELKKAYSNSPGMFTPSHKGEPEPRPAEEIMQDALTAKMHPEAAINAEAFFNRTEWPEQVEFKDYPAFKDDPGCPQRIPITRVPQHCLDKLKNRVGREDFKNCAHHYLSLAFSYTDSITKTKLQKLYEKIDGWADHDSETLKEIEDVLTHLKPVKKS